MQVSNLRHNFYSSIKADQNTYPCAVDKINTTHIKNDIFHNQESTVIMFILSPLLIVKKLLDIISIYFIKLSTALLIRQVLINNKHQQKTPMLAPGFGYFITTKGLRYQMLSLQTLEFYLSLSNI